MDILPFTSPNGTAWELLVAVVVILIGPLVMERCRIPGMIGFLLGGMIVGPNVLNVVHAGGVVTELGEVGLIYLMFMAGLDLDLAVFRKHRRDAVAFSLMTFMGPMIFGVLAGLAVGYELNAAILLGSIFASHTLVSYPIIRRYGLSTNRAVATTVGATVLTDTLALVVLAVIAGQQRGDASGGILAGRIVVGLVVLVAFCFVLLPVLARWYFSTLGQQRAVRYTFTLAVLLAGGVIAEVVGIEAIVGAFFAGLAVNRLIPNEGEFMERIEFFGTALLIPIFLVSVGTVIDPSVLVDPGTLGLAAVFTVACIGGKLLAAALCRPAFRFTWDEVGVVFSLSVAQAAATLAATFIGLQIGLLDTSAVNAIMLVIVVSLVASSLCATYFGRRVPPPPMDASRLGRSVLVHLAANADEDALVRVAARLASADGGIVRPLVVVGDGVPGPDEERLQRIERVIGRLGIDAEPEVRRDSNETEGVAHAAASHGSSMVVAPAAAGGWLPALLDAPRRLVGSLTVPVAFVRPGTRPPSRVVLVLASAQARRPLSATRLAVDVVGRLQRDGLPLLVVTDGEAEPGLLAPLGDVEVVTTSGPAWLADHARPDDMVVLPGGRNGAIGSGRAARQASLRGATVLTVADADAVGTLVETGQTLGM